MTISTERLLRQNSTCHFDNSSTSKAPKALQNIHRIHSQRTKHKIIAYAKSYIQTSYIKIINDISRIINNKY
jgi:hypothetical protein